MHKVVKAQRQGREHCGLERDDRRGHKQLLERAKAQFAVERGEHLLLGHHNIAHHAAVVKQAVVVTVARIEIDLDRHHKVDGRDECGQKRNECGHVMVRSPVKQAFDLHANRTRPDNNQVYEKPQVGKQPRKRKRHKLVEPAQKTPGTPVTPWKIPVQQYHIPGEHDAVA